MICFFKVRKVGTKLNTLWFCFQSVLIWSQLWNLLSKCIFSFFQNALSQCRHFFFETPLDLTFFLKFRAALNKGSPQNSSRGTRFTYRCLRSKRSLFILHVNGSLDAWNIVHSKCLKTLLFMVTMISLGKFLRAITLVRAPKFLVLTDISLYYKYTVDYLNDTFHFKLCKQ